MPKHNLLDHCPLQIISYENLDQPVANEIDTYPGEWHTKVARQEWRKLARLVQEALLDAFRRGAAAWPVWRHRVADELQRIQLRRRSDVVQEIYQTYIELLDRIYGALYRHILHNVPTSIPCGTGRLQISRVVINRYPRLRDAGKPALQELLELVYEGSALQVQAEYSWEPLGDGLDPSGRWKRRVGG